MPKPFVSVTVSAAPGATLAALIARAGGASIASVSDEERPPPGAAVNTDRSALPTAATSPAGIVAWIVWVFTTRVGLSAPFHRTVEKPVNPLPVIVCV